MSVKKIDRILAKVINDYKFDCNDVNWVLDFYSDEIEQIRNNIISIISYDLKKQYPFMKDD